MVILSEFLMLYTFILLTKIPAFASFKKKFFAPILVLSKLTSKKFALLMLVSIPSFLKCLKNIKLQNLLLN